MTGEIKILVAEDESHIARAILAILKKGLAGYAVDYAKNGQEALQMASENDYRLIISDWSMPKKNGDELLAELRTSERHAEIPFVMLTARGDRDSVTAALDAGANDYVIKPFKTSEFLAKVKALLHAETKVSTTPGRGPNTLMGPIREVVELFKSGDVTLPVLPEVTLKINDLFNSSEVSVDEMARVVEPDAAITSRLLSVANNPLLRGSKRCVTVDQAIVRLGIEQARSHIILASSKGLFKSENKLLNQRLKELWDHSLATAYCAMYMARLLKNKRADEVFVLGLLHDIGKLLLVTIVDGLSKKRSGFDEETIKAIMDQLHAEFGAVLLKSWHFDEEFQHIAHYHHVPFDSKNVTPELLIIYLSNLVVRRIGFGKDEEELENVAESAAAKKLNISADMIVETLNKVEASMKEVKQSI